MEWLWQSLVEFEANSIEAMQFNLAEVYFRTIVLLHY